MKYSPAYILVPSGNISSFMQRRMLRGRAGNILRAYNVDEVVQEGDIMLDVGGLASHKFITINSKLFFCWQLTLIKAARN